MILTSIGMIGDRQPTLYCVVQCFTSNATWLRCPDVVCLEIVAIGGGAGGNSGGRFSGLDFGRANVGGAGGGGGGAVVAVLSGGQIPGSACVVVGTGGNGALGRSTNDNGCLGGNGGSSCFGSCLIANGGGATNSGGTPGGGYINAAYGVNECAGIGGGGTIFTGTGTVYNGNNGGGMQANSDTNTGLKGGNGGSACLGGRGGAAAPSVAISNYGLDSTGGSSSTLCGITLGAGGDSSYFSAGGAGQAFGAGGAGGAARKNETTPNAGAGAPGIVMVTQFIIS